MKRMTGACAANRQWTEEDRAELLKRRRAGESAAEIAQAMNRSERAVILAAAKLLGRTRTAIQAFACKHGLTRGRA